MFEIGYTTGTFDLVHSGHYELLKKCKSFCKLLIVGLVTDELGIKQKRRPVMNFEHRKTILENSKYVDHVVNFSGCSKEDDYRKLKFNVLFISDEYINSPEYVGFEEEFTNVPVYYFPRSVGISTSDIYKNIIKDVIMDSEVYTSGTGQDLISYKYKNSRSTIVKTVNISDREFNNTRNNFGMDPNSLPRNWKMLNYVQGNCPNLAGVNPSREVEIFKILKEKEWYPVEEIITKTTSNQGVFYNDYQIRHNMNLLNDERKMGKFCYWMLQDNKGKTFKQIFEKCNKDRIYKKILQIINDMHSLGVVHMDLHADNIIIDDDENIFIIDFGWCIHRSFEMTETEIQNYNKLLAINFDLKHFRESLVTMKLESEIPQLFLE